MAQAATQQCRSQQRRRSPRPLPRRYRCTRALPNREKAIQILSKSIYKELRENGYEPKQIVALATEIISLVTTDIGDESAGLVSAWLPSFPSLSASLLKHSSRAPNRARFFLCAALAPGVPSKRASADHGDQDHLRAGYRGPARLHPRRLQRPAQRRPAAWPTTRASGRACRPSSCAIEQGARVVLASHLGRPKGKPDKKYSLEPVAARLAELLGAEVALTDEPVGDGARKVVNDLHAGAVALLENLRFSPGEEANDEGFARALASYADVYVNDAFGTAHRAHASTVGIAEVRRRQGHRPADGARGEVPRAAARRGRAPVRRDHRRRQGLGQDRRAREPARRASTSC